MYMNVCSSIIPKRQISQCLSTGTWIVKTWYVHTMGYHVAIKRNAILIHATTEVSHKGPYVLIPFNMGCPGQPNPQREEAD